MNDKLQAFARSNLKEGLAKLPEGPQTLFKRMYAGGDMSLSIDQVVDKMPADKLDWAMEQVSRTLQKREG